MDVWLGRLHWSRDQANAQCNASLIPPKFDVADVSTSAAPIKRTAVEKMVNVQIIFLFIILLALSIGSSVGTFVRTVRRCSFRLYVVLMSTLSMSTKIKCGISFCKKNRVAESALSLKMS